MSDKWDQSGFDAALKEELKHTKRTFVQAINTHAYFIARKALWYTTKVPKGRPTAELEQPSGKRESVHLGVMILAKRFRNVGRWPEWEKEYWGEDQPGHGYEGAEWQAAIRNLILRRESSRAFLKSGWIPAIRILETFTDSKSGAAPRDSEARVHGQEKGAAYPAVDGEVMVTKIINSALSKSDEGGKALAEIGGAGLATAFYDETQNIKEYIEKKLAEQFNAANKKL